MSNMDTITIIILTALVIALANAIVIGILVHRIQKRFEANLQNSLSEHQTKFSKNYAKSVETLETLYKILAIFSEEFSNMCFILADNKYNHSPKTDLEVKVTDYEKNKEKLDAYEKYLIENRLYLPADMFFELNKIHQKCWNLDLVLHTMVAEFPPEVVKFMIETFVYETVTHKNIRDINVTDIKERDYEAVLTRMVEEMGIQIGTLEKLYKSVTDIKKWDGLTWKQSLLPSQDLSLHSLLNL